MKNREREQFTFANINLLGKCNVDCFFCLGKDIESLLSYQYQLDEHFEKWKNFRHFAKRCQKLNIKKIYLTGQNTDPLMYRYLPELIVSLKTAGFLVGLRSNGFLAEKHMKTIQMFNEEIGYSIHTFNPMVQKMILGKSEIPDWENIILKSSGYGDFNPVRISIVVNRCNEGEIFQIIKKLSGLPVKYFQVRKISTDTRFELLQPDMDAYERVYTRASHIFDRKAVLWKDADVFDVYGKDVVFWRTIKTSVNSINYFTDGTISEEYFIVEGYLNNYKK